MSGASGLVVEAQPPPGACHARGSGVYSLPDPGCTPGALNPRVTQQTIGTTICVSGYTSTVRPSEGITEPEKRASMLAYGDPGDPSAYEYDHLVSLELGGAVNDARNLWPEPGASPNPKDTVENQLHARVCSGQMMLAAAQHIIATNWVGFARHHDAGYAPGSGATSIPAPAAAPAAGSSGGPDKPVSAVNCSDFPTHAGAQRWFVEHGGSPSNDVAGLDANHNGVACESLP